MTERKTYDVTASKDGRWWLVQVPELDTVGQARNAAEVEEVAREIIGLWLDVEPDTFDIRVSIEIPGEAREAWEESKAREAVARMEESAAAILARRAVLSLRAEGLTFKDAGVVLGLSPQRVQQLAASAPTPLEESARANADALTQLAQYALAKADALTAGRTLVADFKYTDISVGGVTVLVDAKALDASRSVSDEAGGWHGADDEWHNVIENERRHADV